MTGTIYSRQGGTWTAIPHPFARQAGAWTAIKTAYQRQAGAWVQIWNAVTASISGSPGGTANVSNYSVGATTSRTVNYTYTGSAPSTWTASKTSETDATTGTSTNQWAITAFTQTSTTASVTYTYTTPSAPNNTDTISAVFSITCGDAPTFSQTTRAS